MRTAHEYAPFYCEENVLRLCPTLGASAFAVLVTNARRSVEMLRQRAGGPGHGAVLWDYHVFALARGEEWLVWDLDTTLGFPVPAARWFAGELYEPLRALIDSASARGRGIFRNDALLAELDAARGKQLAVDAPFFRMANVESWLSMLSERRTRGAHTAAPIAVRDPSAGTHRRASDPSRARMIAIAREVPPPTLSS